MIITIRFELTRYSLLSFFIVQIICEWLMHQGAYAIRVEVYTDKIDFHITLFN